MRANALIARMLLADILLTGSDGVAPNPLTAVSRIELRGNTGVNPNQLRMIARVAGVDKLRGVLQGDGLTFYRDNGTDVRSAFDTDGLTIYGDDGNNFELGQGADAPTPGAGFHNSFLDLVWNAARFRMLHNGGADLGYLILQTDSFKEHAWAFHRIGDFELGFTSQTPGMRFTIGNGSLGFGGGVADVVVNRMVGGTYGTGLDMGEGHFKARDIYAVRPAAPTTGYFFMGNTGKHIGYNGVEYVIPGANVVATVVPPSSRALKRAIVAVEVDVPRFLALHPHEFVMCDDADARPHLGFIAEDVRDALPLGAVALRGMDGEPTDLLGLDPIAIDAAQQAVLLDHHPRIAALERQVAAQQEMINALEVRLARLEGAAK